MRLAKAEFDYLYKEFYLLGIDPQSIKAELIVLLEQLPEEDQDEYAIKLIGA